MRPYKIIKVCFDGQDCVAVVAQDWDDPDAWAVVNLYPMDPDGMGRARRYVEEVHNRQSVLLEIA